MDTPTDIRGRPVRLRPQLAVLAVAAALVLGGCGSGDDWSEPHAAPSAVGSLKPGFVSPTATPTPEATITPAPGSWNDVHPSQGYRVVLLSAGKDRPTKTLVTAVLAWAQAEDVSLRTIRTSTPRQRLEEIHEAIAMKPDLIISVGNDLVDPLTTISAAHLDQQFLVVGAELAEPTHNVTAADWAGASFRGEGLGTSSTYDPASFTAARSGRAVRAGVASILNDLTGIVVWIG